MCFRWLITLIYAGVIFYLSSIPSVRPPLFPYSDKVIHFFMYAGLAVLCAWSLFSTRYRLSKRLPWIAITAAVFYGITDEFHQMFVPTRTAEVSDLLANTVGAVVGVLIYVKIRKRITKKGTTI